MFDTSRRILVESFTLPLFPLVLDSFEARLVDVVVLGAVVVLVVDAAMVVAVEVTEASADLMAFFLVVVLVVDSVSAGVEFSVSVLSTGVILSSVGESVDIFVESVVDSVTFVIATIFAFLTI